MKKKVIITAALSGSVTLKEHNPNVPYTPEEFVREAVRAEEAGAAVVHVHFRDPVSGTPTTDPAGHGRGGRGHPGEHRVAVESQHWR